MKIQAACIKRILSSRLIDIQKTYTRIEGPPPVEPYISHLFSLSPLAFSYQASPRLDKHAKICYASRAVVWQSREKGARNMKDLQAVLQAEAEAFNLSITEIALKAEVRVQTVRDWLSGKRKPSQKSFIKIAQIIADLK